MSFLCHTDLILEEALVKIIHIVCLFFTEPSTLHSIYSNTEPTRQKEGQSTRTNINTKLI